MQFRNWAMGTAIAMTAAIAAQSAAVSSPRFTTPTHPTLAEVTQAQSSKVTQFRVRVENISARDQFTASNGTRWTLDFSPGVWLVTDLSNPLFTVGQPDRGQGIEAIAEDGNPTKLAQSLQNQTGIQSSGVFNTPVGAAKVGGIRPGQGFEFTIRAVPGQRLFLATMFGQSNDWFYAPSGSGIALFDASGQPIRGDVTSQIALWNAGTEVDEEPGIGPTQGPRQSAPNTGVDENGVVQAVNSQSAYAQTSKVMRVTITPEP